MLTHVQCSEHLLCSFLTSVSKSRQMLLKLHLTNVCLKKKLVITGRADGCTCSEFGDYVMETITQMTK